MTAFVVVGVVARDVERERLVAQLGEHDGVPIGEGVGGGDGQDDGLVLEAVVLEVVGDLRAEGDGEVEPAVADGVDQRSGRVVVDVQVERGMSLGERGEQRLEPVARAGGEPELQVACDAAAGGAGGGQRVVGRAQRDARGLEQGVPGVGELDAAGRAAEQLDAEVRLAQLFDGRSQLLVYHFCSGPAGTRAVRGARWSPTTSTAAWCT